MTAKKQESWFVKNMFSLIALSFTIGGFIAGYTKLQYTVQDLKSKSVDKELIRQITTEVVKQELIPMQKDIAYLQKDLDRAINNINRLYKKNNKFTNDIKVMKTK